MPPPADTSPGPRLWAVAVFCGSSPGRSPAYADAAVALGRCLVRRGIGLVYGGGAVGLMGVLANEVLAGGGDVHGVITQDLMDREVGHPGLTRLDVVTTMHERKARMVAAADAVMVLPGGMGTLDELFEAATWTQLGIHRLPCAVLDVDGYYAPLGAWLDRAVEERFVPAAQRGIVAFGTDPDALLDGLAAWQPPVGGKWLDREAPTP